MADRPAALVTGGSRGIGAEIARALARDGLDVAIGYHRHREAAHELAGTLRESGVDAIAVPGDVRTPQDGRALVSEAGEHFGRLDVLINNAGTAADGPFGSMTEEAWNDVVATNLSGAFHCTQPALPLLRAATEPAIVNVVSIVGINGNAGQANYAASKAGLIGLTKSLARELAPDGVTVNAVAGGFILTDMTLFLEADVMAANLQGTPLRRAGEPADMAEAVAFLCGPKARFITGAVLAVDGGLSL